jgi:DNA-binding transcriptional LysR family regulator
MLDVRRLLLLRDLAHLGTIAAVARAHTYTPSAVSQQLAVLEREAGVSLLERTGRRVTLTRAGAVLVQHADTVLAALERASAAVATAGTELSGPLRIGAFPSAVRTVLPAALVALGRDHPRLELMVSELDPAAMPDALRQRRLDVGLLHDYDAVPVEPDPALDAVPLLEETVYLAGPAGSTPRSIEAARAENWIVGSPGTLCHRVALSMGQAAGFALRVRHHADDFATVLALVAAGQGVSLVPRLAATPRPAGVTLIPLPLHRRTRLAYRRSAAAHPAVAACVAAITAATKNYLALDGRAGTSSAAGDPNRSAVRNVVPEFHPMG